MQFYKNTYNNSKFMFLMRLWKLFIMAGFGLCGIPENLISGLLTTKTCELTVVSNNAGNFLKVLS